MCLMLENLNEEFVQKYNSTNIELSFNRMPFLISHDFGGKWLFFMGGVSCNTTCSN